MMQRLGRRSNALTLLALLALVVCVLGPADAQQLTLSPVAHTVLATEYFDVAITEYRFADRLERAGGALLLQPDGIIVASPDGGFTHVDPKTWAFRIDCLPSLNDLGTGTIKASRRYSYQELLPRVHGMTFVRDTYYVSYDQYRPSDDSVYFVISKLKQPAKRWTEIYRSPALDTPYYPLGGGGVMVASPSEDRVYFTTGDYSLDRINHLPSDLAPQNPALPFGKTNYIDVKNDSYHMFTLGHRNGLGLVLLSDGRLLESENGPRGGDTLNILVQGKNYGWPYTSYGTLYASYRPYSDSLIAPAKAIYEQPMYAFIPSISPTQLVQVSSFDPHWDGNVLLGSLAAKTLYNIKLAGDRVLYVEPIRIGARIRDLVQFGDFFILLTDSGTLIKIEKSS